MTLDDRPRAAGPRPAAGLGLALALALAPIAARVARADLPTVPEGFDIRLVASVPAVAFPTQVATAPGGWLFVGEDPMDQVGPYEADDGRILLFRDGADPVVYAEGLRPVFGMAWREGSLYVMHMPYLSVFRDEDGDGKAESRKDLFKDLGPKPIPGALNDHLVSGLQFGMDGWLYIATGDKGVPGATRPEDGVKVQLKGGGTLRCRPDGTGLEVFTSGTRNHLEPNLDAADNLFTYDNTDDGDGWWTRVTHHVDGGYYGYPYDYHDHPERFLPRMAEYGGGSPCGAVFYKDDAWPEKYRNIGLWAEWGKGKVQAFRFEPKGASFELGESIDFVVPRGGDNFHPIDLALSDDGTTLYIADWNMGGWGNKQEKVGRVYAVTYKGGDVEPRARGEDSDAVADQIRALDHPAHTERMRAQRALIAKGREALDAARRAALDPETPVRARMHLIWALDGIAGGTPEATLPLVQLLGSRHAELRREAARALGQRSAPLDEARAGIIALVGDAEPTVRLHAVIALGRIGQADAIPAVLPVLADPDVFLAFSARAALRRIGDWAKAAEGLKTSDAKVRQGVLLAMEGQYHPEAVEQLASFAFDPARPGEERARAISYLAEVHRRAKPWDGSWWGTRPTHGNPPPKVLDWEGTPAVLAAIRRAVADPEPAVRLAAVGAVRATGDEAALASMTGRFGSEDDHDVRAAMARVFGELEHEPALPALIVALQRPDTHETVRDGALAAVEAIGGEAATRALLGLLDRPGLTADQQARAIGALGRFGAREAVPALLTRLGGPDAAVRAAAAEALGRIGRLEGVAPVLREHLDDPDVGVRKAAIAAEARLRDREAVADLMRLADADDTRYEAMMALADVSDVKALQIYLRGLADRSPEMRQASARAMKRIREDAAPILDELALRRELPPSALPELRKIYSGLVPVGGWRILGPVRPDALPLVGPDGSVDLETPQDGLNGRTLTWRQVRPADDRGQIDLGREVRGDNRAAFGYAEVNSDSARRANLSVGSDDTLTVWLNGKQVYDFQGNRGYEPEADRVEVELAQGVNRFVVKCGNAGGGWQYSLALSSPVEYAFLEAPAAGGFDPESYRAFALEREGDPARGRALFADLKGLACIKCHKVGGEGGTVGPDLAGIGGKYRREEVVESVLYPSAKIFSGYEPVVVATSDGRVLTGIVKSDDDKALVIQDAEDKPVTIPKDEIDDRRASNVSLMPNGLAEGLSREDFADLIGYLMSLKEGGH
jgi:putative membrane-bound dehydrogenase-like protein